MLLLGCFQTLAFAARGPARIHAVHMQLSATSGAVTPFEDWAEATGINAPKLAVIGREDLRGVVVLEDVKEGEELCCVPRTSCLDLSAVEGSGSPCEAFVPTSLWVSLRWYERLACWLLAEERRGQESPIVGYLGYLPRPESFANAPLVWTDDELAELCYPPVVVAVREQASELMALHAALVGGRGGPLASTVTLDELRWAMQLVLSRAFTSTIATPAEHAKRRPPPPPPPPSPTQVAARMWFGGLPVVGKMFLEPPPPPPPPPLGDGLEMAMMPMLDAFNHASRAATQCSYDGERNAFVMKATAALRRGDQAFISYGDKSNDELLQLFGFVEEGNPFDVVLSIGLEDFVCSAGERFFVSDAAMEVRAHWRACSRGSECLLSASFVRHASAHARWVLIASECISERISGCMLIASLIRHASASSMGLGWGAPCWVSSRRRVRRRR